MAIRAASKKLIRRSSRPAFDKKGPASDLAVGVFGQSPGGWPMKSDAMGVNPLQIPEAMAADAAKGVQVEYDPESGEAIYNDPAQRKAHCEANGMADRNGGYSDPQVGGSAKYDFGYDSVDVDPGDEEYA